MKMKKSYIITLWILALAPLAILLFVYPMLPEKIIMHWGFDGAVRYDPKASIWGMAALSPILAILFTVMPKIDPKRRNYEKFGAAYQSFAAVMELFLLVMHCIVISEALFPNRISVYMVVTLGVGLLFAFLGNILPKVKSNFYMGVRTPWTISDPDVWFKANRLSGHLMFGSGLLLCLCPFALSEKLTFAVLMITVIVVAVLPTIMSYIWYKQRHSDK